MWKLKRYLKGYKVQAVLAPLFKLLEAVFELLVPLIVAALVDRGLAEGEPDSNYIIKMTSLLILFAVIGLFSAITAQYFSSFIAAGFGSALRKDLFSHILSLSHRELDEIGKNTLITRITQDTQQIQNGVNMFFRLVLRSPFIVAGGMVMAFMIHPMAGLIFALVLLLLLIIIVFFMGKIIGMHRRVQQSLDRVQESVSDNLTGARVIRAFGQEEKERSSFRDLTAKHYFLQMMQGNVTALLNPSTLLTINGGILALLYFGGIRVQAGELTGGEVIALVNYMLQILTELVRTAQLTLLLSRAQACSVRVNEVFAIKNSLPLPAAPLFLHRERFEKEEEILAFDRVTFSYAKASRPALSDVSFSLRRGQTLGIIGGTGSGKTTLIQLIPRFYDVSSGSIRIAGRDIREYDLDSLRSFVGLVEQKTRLFEGTIKSNLAWGRPETNEREMECSIDLSQARTVVEAKEKGLNSPVEQKGSNYSGGQKQRLSIARTLIKEAPLLILDDASSALDYLTDRKLRKSLASLSATKIIVSQRVASIRHADCILLLDKGRIAAMGSHSFLLSESALYREICDSQLTRTEVTE